MILSENMVENLYAIEEIETQQISDILDLPLNDLGNSLIDVYYSTTNLKARTLITDFMNEAGVEWMHKLVTRDTSPVEASDTIDELATYFTSLVAANDAELSVAVG